MFPSVINTFNIVAGTDRLNSPSHSALHNSVSSVVTQMQTVIGTNTTSAIGTIIGDLRNPASDGGGHVQTAVKGGTGQTTFTKGDLLVATGPSVISKLAVSSTNGEILTVDSNQASGIKWAASPGATKVAVTTSSVVVTSVLNSDVVLYATSILGSTLGTNNAVKFKGMIQNLASDSSQTFNIKLSYGNNVVASITGTNPTVGSVMTGHIEGVIAGYGGVSSQIGYISMDAWTTHFTEDVVSTGQNIHLYKQNTSSVESSANQNLIITGKWTGGTATRVSIVTGIFVAEKIV